MDPLDIETPGSPGWWINRLAWELHNRRTGRWGRGRGQLWSRTGIRSPRVRPPLLLLDDYMRGDPPLHEDIHRGWAEPFRRFVRMGRINVADLLVGSTSSRMSLRGFRTAAANDDLGDAKAAALMKNNGLKTKARDVHDLMLGLGTSYTIVTPPDDTRDFSLITAESPLQCITAHDAATGETLAGLKMFRDEYENTDWAYLFLPGELWVAKHEGPATIRTSGIYNVNFAGEWQWDTDRFDTVPNNQVAMVRFQNRKGVGEFEEHLDALDRINDKMFNEWWISKIQAFRQRAVMLDDEDDTEDDDADLQSVGAQVTEVTEMVQRSSNPLYDDSADLAGIFTSAPDAMWRLPKDAQMWESTPVNIEQLTKSIEQDLKNLAAMVRISLPSISPDIVAHGSAEGANLMREEHIYHVEDRLDRVDNAWAQTMALAFAFQGDLDRADVSKIETMFGPVQRYSLTERTQGAQMLNGVLPWEAIMTDVMQYEPADVQERLSDLRARDLLFQPPPPAPADTPPTPPAAP